MQYNCNIGSKYKSNIVQLFTKHIDKPTIEDTRSVKWCLHRDVTSDHVNVRTVNTYRCSRPQVTPTSAQQAPVDITHHQHLTPTNMTQTRIHLMTTALKTIHTAHMRSRIKNSKQHTYMCSARWCQHIGTSCLMCRQLCNGHTGMVVEGHTASS